ncbi:MAG: FtsX-like permease family protein [Parvularculales bacterium]
MINEFGIALRLARRELRSGLSGFRIFLACLTLGVAAIAAVGSVSSSLVEGMASEGQSILGGDIDVRLVHRPVDETERAWIEQAGSVSEVVTLRAMAGTQNERTLVELKAVDDAYPLYGTLTLDPPLAMDDALKRNPATGLWGAVAVSTLADRLGIVPGDVLRLGDADVELRALLIHEPDLLSAGFGLGPRLLVGQDALDGTGLVRPGSIANWHYRVRLPETQQEVADIANWTAETQAAFPDAGWRIQDRSDGAPGVRRFIERISLFLGLVGLTALVVGGVGVGNAVRGYVDGRQDVIATFKCLGSSGSLIFKIYLLQVMALAMVGIVVGIALGALTPLLLQTALVGDLPVPARITVYPAPLFLAAVYGVLVAFLFAVWPLARARDIPPARLFRDIIETHRSWPRFHYVALAAGTLALLVALAIGLTEERRFAIWFVLGLGASFILLRLTAWALMKLARKAPRLKRPSWRMALANLHRPGAPTPGVVLSLGLGLTLLVTIAMIDGNIIRQVENELPERAPSFFFVGLQNYEFDEFERLLSGVSRGGPVEASRVPMLRGRIVSLGGTPSENLTPPPDVAWVLRGDRGLTYESHLPQGSTLVRGSWWPEDYDGPPLVSLDEELARGFGLDIGDTLTVNVLGRRLTATIANTRQINWNGLGINFVLVFSPNSLVAAPHSYMASVTMDPQDEEPFQKRVATALPHVTIIRIKETLEQINDLLASLTSAVRVISSITLLAGTLVLAGAMAAGYSKRLYESVVLKVLGATRGHIIWTHVLEYSLLGLITACIAALIGTIAAWAVLTEIMETTFVFLPGVLAGTAFTASVITVILGLVGTWRVLGQKSMPILRARQG